MPKWLWTYAHGVYIFLEINYREMVNFSEFIILITQVFIKCATSTVSEMKFLVLE